MKRRTFLVATGSTLSLPTLTSSTLASQNGTWHEVDFETLIEELFSDLPEKPKDLRDELATLAHTIHEKGDVIDSALIEAAFTSVKTASTLTRRTQFLIQILHNNDLGRFEEFAYALAAFALEVGLWWFGAPYKMAWRGTRFVSNRTLLRASRYLDNRLIALLMSEVHWKIREKVYDEVSADNLQSIGGEVEYVLTEFDELREYAVDEGVQTNGDETEAYLREVNLQMDKSDVLCYDFIDSEEGSSDEGIFSDWRFDTSEWDFDFIEQDNSSVF
ncbi:hypothetical protein [Haloferax sp. YSSS75]|uniref:hypothetical protein n=1 Tax=Haloferax sp. YSSS75 TaxID=3388564 RepID=UPI00398D354C